MSSMLKSEAIFHAAKQKKTRPEEDDRDLGWNLVRNSDKRTVDGNIVEFMGVGLQEDDEVVITVSVISRVETRRVKL
jgi:hypothetical protein